MEVEIDESNAIQYLNRSWIHDSYYSLRTV